MPWWAETNKPEPSNEPEPEPEVHLNEEGKRKAWRLLALLDAFRALHEDAVGLDEIDLLGRVASGHEDLHEACAALRNGCSLELLVVIFT